MLGITAVGFGFYVGPPHVLLPLGEGPGALAGHRTGLTTNAPVDVDDKCNCSFGPPAHRGTSSVGQAASYKRKA